MNPRRSLAAFVFFVAALINVYAQAAVEYAGKAASGTLSSGGSQMSLGSCRLDSTLISCVKHYYPGAFYVTVMCICVTLAFLLYPRRRV